MPYNSGEGLYNAHGENNYINTRNGSKSNDHFNHINEVSALLGAPENVINKSKSNMDISSYHRLQHLRMTDQPLRSNFIDNRCAFNGQIISSVKYCPNVSTIPQSEKNGLITQPNIFRPTLPAPRVENTQNSRKFIFS